MTDDGFFREVNEELRSDKVKAFWKRYGSLLIGAVVALVVGTGVFAFYEYWTEKQASQSGDQFLAALNLVRDGKNDEALKTLDQLEKDGYGAYPVLARMRAAGVIAQKGDLAGAVAPSTRSPSTPFRRPSAISPSSAPLSSSSIPAPMMTWRPAPSRFHPTAIPCATPPAKRLVLPPGRPTAVQMRPSCSSRFPMIRLHPPMCASSPIPCLIC